MLYPSSGPEYTYAHVTGKTADKCWPGLPMEHVWGIFCRQLKNYVRSGGPQVNAFVLMSNHFHLLITERLTRVSGAANKIANDIEEAVCNQNRMRVSLFEATPEHFLITDLKHLRHVYRYIYQNPVRAGLARRAEEYAFSSLGFLLARKSDLPPPPVTDTFGIIYDPGRMLRWINTIGEFEEFWHVH